MHIRSGIFLVTALTSILLFPASSLASGEYETGLQLYGKKQYSVAAQYFEAASLHDPSNVQANYYAGYSFYLGGRKAEAITSFWRLAKAFPSRKEGMQARAFLQSLDPLYAQHDGQVSPAAKTEAISRASTATVSLSPRTVVDRLVQVKRSNGKFPEVTPEFVESIKSLLVAMPLSVLACWQEKGGSVVIAPSVVEIDYRIQNTVPRGWDQDASWKDSPAMTHGSQVVVSQYKLGKSGETTDNTAEIGVVRHEAGHAIDYCLGSFTQTDEFKHAYYLDSSQVPEENRQRLYYFLQKAAGGPSETFAELFCYRMGGETDSGRKEICDLVHKSFPTCDKLIVQRLARLGN